MSANKSVRRCRACKQSPCLGDRCLSQWVEQRRKNRRQPKKLVRDYPNYWRSLISKGAESLILNQTALA